MSWIVLRIFQERIVKTKNKIEYSLEYSNPPERPPLQHPPANGGQISVALTLLSVNQHLHGHMSSATSGRFQDHLPLCNGHQAAENRCLVRERPTILK